MPDPSERVRALERLQTEHGMSANEAERHVRRLEADARLGVSYHPIEAPTKPHRPASAPTKTAPAAPVEPPRPTVSTAPAAPATPAPSSAHRPSAAPAAAGRPERPRNGDAMNETKVILHIRPGYAQAASKAALAAGARASTRTVGDAIEVTAPAWAENAIKGALGSFGLLGSRRVTPSDAKADIRNARRKAGL